MNKFGIELKDNFCEFLFRMEFNLIWVLLSILMILGKLVFSWNVCVVVFCFV